MTRRGCALGTGFGRAEEQREQHEHRRRRRRREQPDAIPGVATAGQRERIDDAAGDPGADEHPDAERDEGDESLRRGAQVRRRLLVHVDLSGHEEEVVADAVQQDAAVEHPHQRSVVAVGKQQVARRPCGHADEQHVLDAEPAEEQRHDQHEADLGHLAERHLPGRVARPGSR